jgi:hypothetical protein
MIREFFSNLSSLVNYFLEVSIYFLAGLAILFVIFFPLFYLGSIYLGVMVSFILFFCILAAARTIYDRRKRV